MSEKTCGRCRFWMMNPTEEEHEYADDFGECRIRAPIANPDPDKTGLWPTTSKADWCGEYQSDKPERRI